MHLIVVVVSCWQHGSLFPSSIFPPFVDVCLVVNLIFLYLPTCSTSFHEAFLFCLSFIINSSIHIAILIFYCEIFSCAVFASSSCSLGFSSASYLHCRWSWRISGVGFSTPTWYQSLPAASCSKDFLSRDLESQTLVCLCIFLQFEGREFFWSMALLIRRSIMWCSQDTWTFVLFLRSLFWLPHHI